MGRQLAAMHVVLARDTDDPSFKPRIATDADVARWRERTTALLTQAFELIEKRVRTNDGDDGIAETLVAERQTLFDAMRSLEKAAAGTLMTRIHGDFHLGQVLVATGDAYIIDFEGEPGRPLAERRAKASPLRDVAGLLRSFDYAVATTLDPKMLANAPLAEDQRARFITRMRDGASKAFLDAYYAGVAELPGLQSRELLDFFLIEKAAYEVIYEAQNRPTWLSIPLQGLHRLVTRIVSNGGRAA